MTRSRQTVLAAVSIIAASGLTLSSRAQPGPSLVLLSGNQLQAFVYEESNPDLWFFYDRGPTGQFGEQFQYGNPDCFLVRETGSGFAPGSLTRGLRGVTSQPTTLVWECTYLPVPTIPNVAFFERRALSAVTANPRSARVLRQLYITNNRPTTIELDLFWVTDMFLNNAALNDMGRNDRLVLSSFTPGLSVDWALSEQNFLSWGNSGWTQTASATGPGLYAWGAMPIDIALSMSTSLIYVLGVPEGLPIQPPWNGTDLTNSGTPVNPAPTYFTRQIGAEWRVSIPAGQTVEIQAANRATGLRTRCGLSDVAGPNQSAGFDGSLTADDIIVFLGWYFASDARADVAGPNQATSPDGVLNADDIIVFLARYFAGC